MKHLSNIISNTACALCMTAHADENKPNIVVIFGDDIGYGDFSCYGAKKVSTPNIVEEMKEIILKVAPEKMSGNLKVDKKQLGL